MYNFNRERVKNLETAEKEKRLYRQLERAKQHLKEQLRIVKKLEKEIKKIKNERKFETARKGKRVNVIDSDSDDDDDDGVSPSKKRKVHSPELIDLTDDVSFTSILLN